MNYSVSLKKILNENAKLYIEDRYFKKDVHWYHSIGQSKTILFLEYSENKHGNFLDSSYHAIMTNEAWKERLKKQHSQKSALPKDKQSNAKELDSSNSSDALLMNIFCYPDLHLTALFNDLIFEPTDEIYFGYSGKVPKINGEDNTEIDMKIGNTIFEAKLTENDFTAQSKDIVESYTDFYEVFDKNSLPQDSTNYYGYQLIRNILCAKNKSCFFNLLIDERRLDLIKYFWLVARSIKDDNLRFMCNFITWQDLTRSLPTELNKFLSLKYGIC